MGTHRFSFRYESFCRVVNGLELSPVNWIRWKGVFSKIDQFHHGLCVCTISIASNWNSIRFQLQTCPNFRFTFQHVCSFDGSLFLSHCTVCCCSTHQIIYCTSIAFEIGIVEIKSLKFIYCSWSELSLSFSWIEQFAQLKRGCFVCANNVLKHSMSINWLEIFTN